MPDYKEIRVNTVPAYTVTIGPGLLKDCGPRLREVIPPCHMAVVTDSTVGPLYLETVTESLKAAGYAVSAYEFPAGEESKNVSTLSDILEFLAKERLTRSDCLIALGGGVAGDMAGFAAAVYLRGIRYVQLPTPLLAAVDSSVGGKVAVDLEAGKNLAGAFYQPRLVLMDPDTLDTLDDDTFAGGMAEVVKYGCIWDAEFFDFLTARPSRESLMADIEHILYTSCDIKRKVVIEDELDTGLRMILNFGHTLGHAYELAGHYVEWSHGEAGAAGNWAPGKLGGSPGGTPPGPPRRVGGGLASLGLPTLIHCTAEEYAAAIGLDKKGAGSDITLILLDQMGHAVPHKMPKARLIRLLNSFNQVP